MSPLPWFGRQTSAQPGRRLAGHISKGLYTSRRAVCSISVSYLLVNKMVTCAALPNHLLSGGGTGSTGFPVASPPSWIIWQPVAGRCSTAPINGAQFQVTAQNGTSKQTTSSSKVDSADRDTRRCKPFPASCLFAAPRKRPSTLHYAQGSSLSSQQLLRETCLQASSVSCSSLHTAQWWRPPSCSCCWPASWQQVGPG